MNIGIPSKILFDPTNAMGADIFLTDDGTSWEIGDNKQVLIDLQLYQFINGIKIKNGKPGLKKFKLYYFDTLLSRQWKKILHEELKNEDGDQIFKFETKFFPARMLKMEFESTYDPNKAQPKLCVQKGTSITFNTGSSHNVNNLNKLVPLPKKVYNDCNTAASGINTLGENKQQIVIEAMDLQAGEINYFFCGVADHCAQGNMKAEVFVYEVGQSSTCPAGFKHCQYYER